MRFMTLSALAGSWLFMAPAVWAQRPASAVTAAVIGFATMVLSPSGWSGSRRGSSSRPGACSLACRASSSTAWVRRPAMWSRVCVWCARAWGRGRAVRWSPLVSPRFRWRNRNRRQRRLTWSAPPRRRQRRSRGRARVDRAGRGRGLTAPAGAAVAMTAAGSLRPLGVRLTGTGRFDSGRGGGRRRGGDRRRGHGAGWPIDNPEIVAVVGLAFGAQPLFATLLCSGKAKTSLGVVRIQFGRSGRGAMPCGRERHIARSIRQIDRPGPGVGQRWLRKRWRAERRAGRAWFSCPG